MARYEMAGAELGSMAERQPSGESLFQLGIAYATGREVETNLIEAHKWFNLAAMRGSSEAVYYRQEIARELPPAAVAEAQRSAREWLSTH